MILITKEMRDIEACDKDEEYTTLGRFFIDTIRGRIK